MKQPAPLPGGPAAPVAVPQSFAWGLHVAAWSPDAKLIAWSGSDELSLGPGFDGGLPWGMIYNRPFLRSLHGFGLCLWRLGRLLEAEQVFARMLSLNPNDNQGARSCWHEVRNGSTWEAASDRESATLH